MKSKFMRMVGRGVEEPEEEDDVFQEYEEEQPIEHKEENVFKEEQDKVLPLISDAEIDGFYSKFKELGYESVYTEKREYVLDAYIKMDSLLKYSFPQSNLEGSGLLSDLYTDLSNNEAMLETKKELLNEANQEGNTTNQLKYSNEIKGLERQKKDYEEQLPLAREQDVEPENDTINIIYQLQKDIDFITNKMLNTEENNERDAELLSEKKSKFETLTNELINKGFTKDQITILTKALSDSIPQSERGDGEIIINNQHININEILIKDPSYKNVTSARIMKIVERIGTVTNVGNEVTNQWDKSNVSHYLKDLMVAMTDRGELSRETRLSKSDDEIFENKKKFILASLKYPMLGLLDVDDYGYITLNDKLLKETIRQKGLFLGEIEVLIPAVKQYAQNQTYLQGYFTQYFEGRKIRNEIADFMWDKFIEGIDNSQRQYLNENNITQETFKKIVIKEFIKSISSLHLIYSNIFGDVEKIDYTFSFFKTGRGIRIRPYQEPLFNLYLETKSSYKKLNEAGDVFAGTYRIYTDEKKIYNIMLEALIQNFRTGIKPIAFHTFHLVRKDYVDTIVNSQDKSIVPLESYIVDLFSLLYHHNYTVELYVRRTKEYETLKNEGSSKQWDTKFWSINIKKNNEEYLIQKFSAGKQSVNTTYLLKNILKENYPKGITSKGTQLYFDFRNIPQTLWHKFDLSLTQPPAQQAPATPPRQTQLPTTTGLTPTFLTPQQPQQLPPPTGLTPTFNTPINQEDDFKEVSYKSSTKKTKQPIIIKNIDDITIENLDDFITKLRSIGRSDLVNAYYTIYDKRNKVLKPVKQKKTELKQIYLDYIKKNVLPKKK